jgi:hypothetical protein
MSVSSTTLRCASIPLLTLPLVNVNHSYIPQGMALNRKNTRHTSLAHDAQFEEDRARESPTA